MAFSPAPSGARRTRVRAVSRFELLEDRTLLSTDVWTGAVDSNWSTPGNWSLGVVPGASDTAKFTSGTTNTTSSVDARFAIGSLLIDSSWGGRIDVNQPLTVAGDMTLASGALNLFNTLTISGAGSLWTGGSITDFSTLTNDGTLTISSSGGLFLSSGSLINAGTINQSGTGTLTLLNGVTIVNQANATYDFQSDCSIDRSFGNGTLNNAGTLEKTGGNGTSQIASMFSNSNAIVVQTGTIQLQTSGGTSTGGTFTVAGGATLDLTGTAAVDYSGTYMGSGAGTVLLAAGNLILAGDATFDFPSGLFQWSGGTLDVNGQNLTNSGTITISNTSTAGPVNLMGTGTLTNAGTIDQSGSGNLALTNGIVLNNQSGGSYDFQADSGIGGFSVPGTLNNAGTLEKTGGTGTSQITTPFSNSNAITVQTGTIQLQTSGGTSTGGNFTVASGATLDLTGTANVQYSGTYTGSGSGTVELAAGLLTLAGDTTFNFPAGLFQWVSGSLLLSGHTLTNSGTISISDTAATGQVVLNGAGTLANAGTIDQTGAGSLALGNGSVLNNQNGATYDFQADSSILATFGIGTLNNAGTLEKTVGTGISQITANFGNSNAITVQTGTIQLKSAGGINTGGTFTVAAGATLDLTGGATVNYAGTYTGSGAGTVELAGGTLNLAGPTTFSFPSGLFKWISGNLAINGNTLTNASTGFITLANAADVVLVGTGTLANAGTIDQTGAGNLALANGVNVNNQSGGTYDFQSDSSIVPTSGNGTLDNAGTLEKTGGTGISQITTRFINRNAITVQTGTIQLQSGGPSPSTGGTFTVAAGATLDLTGGATVNYAGTYTGSGAGTVELAGGTLNIVGATTFDFPSGLFKWISGSLAVNGNTPTNAPGGFITLANAGNVTLLGGGTLVNAGTINQTGAGNLALANGVMVDNQSGGTYDFQSDSSIVPTSGNGTLDNAGTLEKTGGAGTSQITTSFINRNAITVQTGTIQLQPLGGISTGGNFTVASGATLDLTGNANVSYLGTYTGSGAGTIELAAGTLTFAGDTTFDFPAGLFQWSGGFLDLNGHTLTNAGTITISNAIGNVVYLEGPGTLKNAGKIDQIGAYLLDLERGAVLDNLSGGTYDFQADASIVSLDASGTLVNAGTLEKTGGSGTSQITSLFINSNAITVQTGTIQLRTSGGVSTGGNFTVASGATLDLTATAVGSYLGTYTGSGSGTVEVADGVLTLAGDTTFNFPAGLFQWRGSEIQLNGHTLTNSGTISISNTAATSTVTLLGGGTLANAGTIDQTGAGGLRLDGTILNNQSGATYDFQTDSIILPGNVNGTLNNAGTLEKTGGTGTSTISTGFTNTGTVKALSGTLSIPNGSSVSNGTLGSGTWIVGSSSTLSLNASIATLSSSVFLLGPGASFPNLASLSTITSLGLLEIDGGLAFSNDGGLTNAGTLNLEPGTFNVARTFTQTVTGTLGIGLGGLTAGTQFGVLSASGTAALAGTFNASTLNGFQPTNLDTFQVMNFSSKTSDFTTYNGLLIGRTILTPAFLPSGNPTNLTLNAIATATTGSITPSNPSPAYGQVESFTAVITPVGSGMPTPMGTVTFLVDGVQLGTAVELSPSGGSGEATSNTSTTIPAGMHTISADYSGDTTYPPTLLGSSLIVTKAPLSVVANDQSRPVGQANPTLTYQLTGFVNGENATTAGVSGSADLSTSATVSSSAGIYPITVVDAGTLSAANYDFPVSGFVNGTLTVTSSSALSFVVTTTADLINGLPAEGSLRAAILASNGHPGKDTVTFKIVPSGATYDIKLDALLPAITDSVVIDARTQPGYQGTPIVIVDGSAVQGSGLRFNTGNSAVLGLAIGGFSDAGILLQSGDGDLIQNCYLGVDPSGSGPIGNGIGLLTNAGSGLTIGGTTQGAGNTISGNRSAGVFLQSAAVSHALIEGNRIGTDATGASAITQIGQTSPLNALQNVGILIDGSSGNTVGGTTLEARNVISGNYVGVDIALVAAQSAPNRVLGNFVGTDATGSKPLGNIVGVYICLASGNQVGGTSPEDANVISANLQAGVEILGPAASGNLVQGNAIGLAADGKGVFLTSGGLFLQNDGVYLEDASSNSIGGPVAGAGNVISGNQQAGVFILSRSSVSQGNLVQANDIGAGPGGSAGPGNMGYGVVLYNANNNQVVVAGQTTNLFGPNGIANIRTYVGPLPASQVLAQASQAGRKARTHVVSHAKAHPSGPVHHLSRRMAHARAMQNAKRHRA
jgi:hypothetical protein